MFSRYEISNLLLVTKLFIVPWSSTLPINWQQVKNFKNNLKKINEFFFFIILTNFVLFGLFSNFWYFFFQIKLRPIVLCGTPRVTSRLRGLCQLSRYELGLGLLHLCWFLAVGPFNTRLIWSWEENKCCYKLSNWQNNNYFHSKWQLRPFWVE